MVKQTHLSRLPLEELIKTSGVINQDKGVAIILFGKNLENAKCLLISCDWNSGFIYDKLAVMGLVVVKSAG